MRPATLFCDRVRALRALGYTPRQLRFLRLALRCGGVCVPRQYATLAGIAPGGRRCLGFFARLIRRGHAVRLRCEHNRAHVYHVHGRALEDAFGDDASRYRRAMSPALVMVRLMQLDAALMTPDAASYAALTDIDLRGDWRAVEPAAGPEDGSSAETKKGPRRLPLIHPIGIEPGGATVFVSLITEASPDRFRRALQGLLARLATVHTRSLFVVFTAPLGRLTRTYRTMVREELESPLSDEDVQGLWRLFLRRQEGAHERRDLPTPPGVAAVGASLFAHPRFSALYRHWMEVRGDAFTLLMSTAAADAIAEGRGRVTYRTLPQQYDHLVPVADQGSADLPVTSRTKEGTAHAHRLNPGSPPHPDLGQSASHRRACGGQRLRRAPQPQEQQADGPSATALVRGVTVSHVQSVVAVTAASGKNRGVNDPLSRSARCAPRPCWVVHTSVPHAGVHGVASGPELSTFPDQQPRRRRVQLQLWNWRRFGARFSGSAPATSRLRSLRSPRSRP